MKKRSTQVPPSVFSRTSIFIFCLATLVKLSACAAEEKRTVNNAVGSVVSEEKLREYAIGGVCKAPTGKSVYDVNVCCDLSDFSKEGIDSYMPSDISLEHIVKPACSGGGYIYRMVWKFTPPKSLKLASRIEWKVYEDEKRRLKPTIDSWNSFLESLTLPHMTEDNYIQFVSRKLVPGKSYVFYLTAHLLGFVDEQKGVNAEVVLYRVVVDLTNAVPQQSGTEPGC